MTGFRPYEKLFHRLGIEYDVVFVDKYGITESSAARRSFPWQLDIDPSLPKWQKALSYARFRSHFRSIQKKYAYDIVITWGLETTLLLADQLLLGKFKYIVNVRDYGPMGVPGLARVLRFILKPAAVVAISSRAFEEWLPKEIEYTPITSLSEDPPFRPPRIAPPDRPIRVCFLGNVRFLDQDASLMRALANDPRFIIQFFGVGSEKLEVIARREKIHNVQFVGHFKPHETDQLLEQADVINNLYGRGVPELDTAISLKYYHALIHGIPILVYARTAMAAASVGISYEFDGSFSRLADELHTWYRSIDIDGLNAARMGYIQRALDEKEAFERKVTAVIDGQKDVR